MQQPTILRRYSSRARNGAMALLFLVAYVVSSSMPFMSGRAYAQVVEPASIEGSSVDSSANVEPDAANDSGDEAPVASEPMEIVALGSVVEPPTMGSEKFGYPPKPPKEIRPLDPTQVEVCGANNDVVSLPTQEGVTYSQTGWNKGKNTVTATANDGFVFKKYSQTKWDFYDRNTLCVVTPETPTVVEVCGANNDVVSLPTQEGVTYSQTGWNKGKNTVTATANDGFVFPGDKTTTRHHGGGGGWEYETQKVWVFTDANTPCAVTPVTPAAPTVNCGANNDSVTLPSVEGLTYASSGWTNGRLTITATANDGYMIPEGLQSSWSFTDENTSCGNVLGDSTTVTPVAKVTAVAATTKLADTGTGITLPMLISSGIIGLALLAFSQNTKRATKLSESVRRIAYRLRQAFTVQFIVPTA